MRQINLLDILQVIRPLFPLLYNSKEELRKGPVHKSKKSTIYYLGYVDLDLRLKGLVAYLLAYFRQADCL